MHKVTILLLALVSSACVGNEALEHDPLLDGYKLPPTRAIINMSQQIVNELVQQNDNLLFDQPLLVATPVLLTDLTTTNALGLQLQQGLIAGMHQHQFNLVDVNVGENIRVTPLGDFILTRNWERLPADIAVEHVLVTTMSLNSKGVVVNARIVDIRNNRVVSVSQGTFYASELPSYLQLSQKVVSRDGLLYRYSSRGMQAVDLIGEKQ